MSDSTMVPVAQGGGLSLDVLTPERIDLLKRTVCRGASDDEFQLFVSVANRAGLDPFSRQIHAVRRGNAMTIQTGIDGYRLIAQRSGQYAGQDDIVYDKEDGEHPNTARCTVYRFVNGQRVGTTKTARWREYAQERSPMWGKMPWAMLGKCAEALALRAAFPQELSGLYTAEEMEQADTPPPVVPTTATVRPTGKRVEVRPKPADEEPPPQDYDFPPESSAPADDNLYAPLPADWNRAAVLKDLTEAGRTGGEVKGAAKELGFVGKALKDLTDAELCALDRRVWQATRANPLA